MASKNSYRTKLPLQCNEKENTYSPNHQVPYSLTFLDGDPETHWENNLWQQPDELEYCVYKVVDKKTEGSQLQPGLHRIQRPERSCTNNASGLTALMSLLEQMLRCLLYRGTTSSSRPNKCIDK